MPTETQYRAVCTSSGCGFFEIRDKAWCEKLAETSRREPDHRRHSHQIIVETRQVMYGDWKRVEP